MEKNLVQERRFMTDILDKIRISKVVDDEKGEMEYKVEKILSKRKRYGKVEYLVR